MVDSPTPTHSLRRARASDAPELARLFTTLGHATVATDVAARWPQWATAGNSALVAVRSDGVLAGVVTLHQMLVLHRPRPVGRITALVVDASARGQGLGRALVDAAEAAFSDAGCGLLEITSNVRLNEAHTFYRHLGYEETSVRFAKVLGC